MHFYMNLSYNITYPQKFLLCFELSFVSLLSAFLLTYQAEPLLLSLPFQIFLLQLKDLSSTGLKVKKMLLANTTPAEGKS